MSSRTRERRAGRCALRAHVSAVVGGLLALVISVQTASAGATPQDGLVVALAGTPHLWVAEGGSLHWAGDTRALANRTVSWSSRVEVSLGELRQTAIGDPWLSTGLVKEGDRISLAKWETNASAPTLLHVQSIADVEIFGISSTNYGRMVIEGTDWERQTGFQLGSVLRGSLESAVPAVTPIPTPIATATVVPARAPAALPLPAVAMPSRPNDSDLNVQVTGVNRVMPSFPQVTVRACNQSRAYEAVDVQVHFSFWDPKWSLGLPTLDSGSARVGNVGTGDCRTVTTTLTTLQSWSSVTVRSVTGSWRSTGATSSGTQAGATSEACAYAVNAYQMWGVATNATLLTLGRICGVTSPPAPDPMGCARLLEASWVHGVSGTMASAMRTACGS